MKGLSAANAASQLVWHTQHPVWLGFVFDMYLGQTEVPEVEIAASHSMLKLAKQSDQVGAKFLASILGKIMSMSPAFGPVSQL